MGVKVATTPCVHWSHPSVPRSPSSSHTVALAISSPSLRRSCGLFTSRVQKLERSAMFGTRHSKLYRSRSYEHLPKSGSQSLRRVFSASLDSFSDEDFSKKIQDLALRFHLSNDDDADSSTHNDGLETDHDLILDSVDTSSNEPRFVDNQAPLDPLEPPDFPERDEIIPASIERKANSVEIPLSIRIIKRKKQWQEGFREAGESACCSVKKAFSSMVFIIRELQSYTLQMREVLFYEDLQGILARVQQEMNASFVWLFQQVFSHTPTLMVYVMILLANYSVHSMANSPAMAAPLPVQAYSATTEAVSVVEDHSQANPRFDSSTTKTFKLSFLNGKTASIGGSSGGGGKYRPLASGTDGDGRFEESGLGRTIIPDGASSIGNPTRTSEGESTSGQLTSEEVTLWDSIVDEASKMQAAFTKEALDYETMQRFVSPVEAKIEADDHEDYSKTELKYQALLAQDPNNALLLANYAQFLYLVTRDIDRAEDYFKRAAEVEPRDAEALNKYAYFLWNVKKDLWAAEETYLEAIALEPSNSYYAANYANFLWNTGGEDTCFPLSS